MSGQGVLNAEKECLGRALTKLGMLVEMLRRAKEKWAYMDDDDQTQLKDSIKAMGGELTRLASCGMLTKGINDFGVRVHKTVEMRNVGANWDGLLFLDHEEVTLLIKQCLTLEMDVERRLSEISAELSKPIEASPTPDDLLGLLFSMYYKSVGGVKVTKKQLERLKQYDDSAIRSRLADIFSQCDQLTAHEKSEMTTRSRTPHTAHETSDFYVNVDYGGTRYRIDFVVKSGREYGDRIPIGEWQQWIRPIEKGSFLSVIISYANLSAALLTRKEDYNRNNDCLREFTEDRLAILFKVYGKLG